jgi:phage host-nuclease inhibitor protein Gam
MSKKAHGEKPVVAIPADKAAAEALAASIVETEAKEKALRLEMNAKLDEVRADYDKKISEQINLTMAMRSALESWGWQNQKQEFSEPRSQVWSRGVIGFRRGQKKLATMSKITWDMVLQKIKTAMPRYIRTKEEVDREKLLADVKTGVVPALDLSAVGLKIVEDDAFYFEAKEG